VASLLRGKLYNARKQSDTERASEGGKAKAAKCQIGIKQETTAAVVATETGVSERTVKRDAKFAERVEALGIEAEVMTGKVMFPKLVSGSSGSCLGGA
jgi:hypothetical protein